MFMRHGDELPKKYDLRTIRLFTCAGEPLNPEALQWTHRVICDNGKTGFVADNWWQPKPAARAWEPCAHSRSVRQGGQSVARRGCGGGGPAGQ